MGILNGYRVIDFTSFLSGPLTTCMLSDMGAEVIRIERPDKKIASGPYLGGERAYDLSIMRGKKSVTLDAKDPQQHELLVELIKTADVIVENFRPGVTKRMGIAYEDVVQYKPDIIYTSISGFGQTGPYAKRGALDIVIQAMSGFMSITGEKDGRPLRAGASVADMFAGLHAVIGTVAMLLHREKTGEGQHLDVSMLDAMFGVSCENAVTRYLNFGQIAGRLGNEHPMNTCFGDFPTKDGTIILAANRDNTYAELCRVLGIEELIDDPRFSTCNARLERRDEIHGLIRAKTAEWETKPLADALLKVGVPCGMINNIKQACEDECIQARNMIIEVDHKTAGTYKVPNSALHFSKTPPEIKHGAPILGQNNREIFSELGMSGEEIDELLKKQSKVRTMFKENALD